MSRHPAKGAHPNLIPLGSAAIKQVTADAVRAGLWFAGRDRKMIGG